MQTTFNPTIRKTLYGIMLAGMVFAVLGMSNTPAVHAQEETTETPVVDTVATQIFLDNLKQISPDGEYAVLLSVSNLGMAGSTIWIANSDNTDMQQIITGDNGSWITNPIWSPDSNMIAYLKVWPSDANQYEVNSRYEIWIVNRDGTNNRLLTDASLLNPALGYGGKTNISWNEDSEIVFYDYSQFPTKQYAVNVSTASVRETGIIETLEVGILSQPSNVQRFYQTDSRWGANQLGTCNGTTISSAGCAITATAMVFYYYGVNTNPGTLNTWLTANGGYANGCEINWATAKNIDSRITWVGWVGQDWDRLKSELDSGYPVILQVSNGGTMHFVVATGYSGNTFNINDPLSSSKTTLGSYGNTFSSMRIYHGPTGNNGSDNAAYVADVTIPDNTVMSPGQGFTKTWRIRNSGSTTWGSGYSFAFVSGDQMSAPSSISVSSTSPDNTTDLSMNMTAPSSSGSYTGYWRMKNSQGQLFGDQLWVKITVSGSSGCSPNADQVAFYVDPNYSGTCVVKGIGNYPDPGSMGISNDSLSSVRVGSNVKLTLYVDSNYGNTSEIFTGDDPNLSDNTISNDNASSAKVETRPTGGSCTNGATSAALQSGYNSCAGEGGTCTFSGQASVAYGANNCFFYQTFVNSVSCGNGTFGDPIVGTSKTCYYKILASPPSANFDAWGLSGTAPFTTSMHIIDTSNITNCSWNYGDGQTGTSCAAYHDHTYNNAGTFTVSLTVSGSGGSNSLTRANYITVASNIDSYEPDNSSGAANWISSGSVQTHNIIPATDEDWVKFQLASPSAIALETTGTSSSDTRMWLYDSNLTQIDYDDDGGTDYYSYIDRLCVVDTLPAGIYYAKIDEYGNDNEILSYNLSFSITQDCTPPSADFDAWGLSGTAPFTTSMHIVDTSHITSCSWNYGDGQTGTSCETYHNHTYNNAGTFTVSLSVSGPGGSDSMTYANYITVSPIPSMPTDLTVTGTTTHSVSLSWQDNSNNETGFNIYRWGYDGSQWTFIHLDSVGANVTTYTQTSLACGSDFNYYEVSAYNGYGESAHAGWVQGVTGACPPAELSITDISVIPSDPFTNDDIYIGVGVQNLSDDDTSSFWIDFYIDPGHQPGECESWGNYWIRTDGLAANSSNIWYVKIPVGTLTAAAHQIYAFVDSGCEITETDETNNVASPVAFTVTDAPPPPVHDDFNAAMLVPTMPYSNTVDVSGATLASDDPPVANCSLAPGLASVWYRYTPAVNTRLALDTTGSSYDTYLAVWSGSRGSLSAVACNDDSGGTPQSALQVNLTANTTYYIEVAQFNGWYSSAAAASDEEPTLRTLPRPGDTEIPSGAPPQPEANAGVSAASTKATPDVSTLAGGTLSFHASVVTYTITGNAGESGVTLRYTDGTAKSITSASNGRYTITVPYNWSGSITPSKTGLTFSPTSKSYSHLTANQASQNYSAVLTIPSTGSYDGYILESTETSNIGGSVNATNTYFVLGDASADRQYRAILAFNTASLPDTATIQSVVVKIKQYGSPVGTNPFSILGSLYTDIRKGYFGTSVSLQTTDFNAAASTTSVAATFGKTPVSGWYSATLTSTGRSYVNKTSWTELRLRFSKDDNDDNGADYMKFYSGNYSSSSYRPQLIITYTLP